MFNTKIKTINEEAESRCHSEKVDPGKIRVISIISFLMGFSQASFLYIMSSYFKLSSGVENVGLFYLAAYSVILVILLNLHKIIKRFGKSDVFHFSLIGKILAVVFLLFVSPGPLAIVLVIAYIIFGNVEWVSMDAILESYSSDRMSGRIRGKYLTIMNAGILLGPFFSTMILGRYGYWDIFLWLLIMNVVISAIAIKSIKKVNHTFRQSLTVKDVFNKVILRKNVRRIFYISFILEFFYALMIMYTPIYLIDLGFSWDKIGIIFTAMLLPFVFFQYPMGVLADKKMGEKELLIFSIFLMGASTLIIYFIGSGTIFVWSVILFATRIGAALIELLRDSYFFKRIDGYDVDIINIFRSAKPMAYIAASAISAVVIFFFSVKAIFILVGIVVLSALLPAIRLVDNKCEREMRVEK